MAVDTFYPVAGANSPVDGRVERGIVDETFSTIRNAATGAAQVAESSVGAPEITSSATTDQFRQLNRTIYTFDTSSIPTSATIISATLSLYGTDKNNSLGGSPEIDIVGATPASTDTLVGSDYAQLGSTVFASKTYADWSTSSYNDFTLNASGLANITKGGISKFGARVNWDTDDSFGGVWASLADVRFNHYMADQTGTDNDPKLVVEYIDQSSSVSPSLSPSSSGSHSASSSISPSPSSSLSPSSSVSKSSSSSSSPSMSPSSSSSVSPSISPSFSNSASVSPSPSAGYSLYSRQYNTTLPTTDSDLSTLYTEDEEDDVAERDNVRVGQIGSNTYMLHQFKKFVGSNSECKVEWEGRSTLAASSSPIYLQIYNHTSGWETIDSNSTVAANTDFEMEKNIPSLTNYKDSQNVVACRVHQLAI